MLVLSRKTKESIMIGDDVRITLVRIDGNKVRIGIDAPKDVRVVRAEIEDKPAKNRIVEGSESSPSSPSPGPRNRIDEPQIFVGSVASDGSNPKLKRAPLSGYVTAG